MATITPTYTDNVSVIALTTLALGATARAVVDWRAKRGGWLFGCFGRGGTTALTAGVIFQARRMMNAAGIEQPVALFFIPSSYVTAAVRPTCSGSGNTAGQALLDVSSTTSITGNSYIFVDGTGGTGNSEWARVSQVTSSTRLTLDAPLQYAHNNTSDHVTNFADCFAPQWVDGGAEIEVILDYGASTTGDTGYVRVLAQTYDSDSEA